MKNIFKIKEENRHLKKELILALSVAQHTDFSDEDKQHIQNRIKELRKELGE